MTGSLRFARAVQVSFALSGLVFLTLTYFGSFGLWGMAVPLASCIACVITAMMLKCHKCGVSYYFDPSTASWSMAGINLLRPVKRKCPKCGAERRQGPS